ncbi:DeoR family transcriptional regulator [Polaribacter aestuariivivens]|uniref:DeoR family transcriptional regulator n=1 Tax=Polaribacter aestuariivivens TaxID=2304626 RepID=UPI003F496FAF
MKKYKKYYTTSEIMEHYQISERTIRYRLLELKEKYKKQPSLLSKKNKKWQIHNTIIEQFAPKRKNNLNN